MTAAFELLQQAVKPRVDGCTVTMQVKVTASILTIMRVADRWKNDEPGLCETLLGLVEDEQADMECTIEGHMFHTDMKEPE